MRGEPTRNLQDTKGPDRVDFGRFSLLGVSQIKVNYMIRGAHLELRYNKFILVEDGEYLEFSNPEGGGRWIFRSI